MSIKIQTVRGTQDFIFETAQSYRQIENLAHTVSKLYGYQEIMTPIFEFSEVFHRSLGETSDAVSKETYDFKDRGGDLLTLRPEGTAGVVRAFLSNGLAQSLPLKLYYSGPMFRYERPQKGRYRQFHQIGVEALGFENPFADVESIAMAMQLLESLGLKDKIQLEINSLGDKESRQLHRAALVSYLTPLKDQLSKESQIRLEKNPLRILDSKDETDKSIISQAPRLENFLNENSKLFFQQVLAGLKNIGLNPVINPHLVRGLDYYTHTVFEITTTYLGAQGAIISGGRYDGLVEQMGGPSTPGVGWGGGLERLMLLHSEVQNSPIPQPETVLSKTVLSKIVLSNSAQSKIMVCVLPAQIEAENFCLTIVQKLRSLGIQSELLLSGNIGKKLKRANKLKATHAIIIGESELNSETLTIKNLLNGEQSSASLSQLSDLFL